MRKSRRVLALFASVWLLLMSSAAFASSPVPQPAVSTRFTLSFWLRSVGWAHSDTYYQAAVLLQYQDANQTDGSGFALRLYNDPSNVGHLILNADGFSYNESAQPLTDGGWHNITTTYDGVYLNVYIDDNQSITMPYEWVASTEAPLLVLNSSTPLNGETFDYDHVVLYDRVLSAAEISAINDTPLAIPSGAILTAPLAGDLNVTAGSWTPSGQAPASFPGSGGVANSQFARVALGDALFGWTAPSANALINPASIPTLSEWGLIALMTLLAASLYWSQRKKSEPV